MPSPFRLRGAIVALALISVVHSGETANVQSTRPLRELTTDRPDSTESPFTVNRGRIQLEMNAASYTRDRANGVRTTEWEIAPFNLRFGIDDATEAGVFLSPYIEVSETAMGAKSSVRGFGDVTLRLKRNFRGNDGGPTAFGMIADVKLPTAEDGLGNDEVEGALTFPISYEVGAGWAGGAMTSIQSLETARGRRAVWFNTITFARDLTAAMGGFLELTSTSGEGSHQATFNVGLTYRTDEHTQWDCGVNTGISEAAPDLGLFAGLSKRF